MDDLTLFGLVAVSPMLAVSAPEARGPVSILPFAGACTLDSASAVLLGVRPFGMVEAVWTFATSATWPGRVAG